jgi:Zn-dependent peptidase ImmA (M78 family)
LAAPEIIAAEILRFRVEKQPAIPGGDEIAGYLDRRSRAISISTRFSPASQRFTFAHELGHCVLHTGNDYFRDRSLSSPDRCGEKPYYEIEADTFAAELLMPRKYLSGLFTEIFGEPLNSSIPSQALAEAVSNGKKFRWSPQALASADLLDRAIAVTKAGFFKGTHFMPLADHFQVSPTAIAIQLLDVGLVL